MLRLPFLTLAIAATPLSAREYTLIIYEAPAQLALRENSGPEGAGYWKGFAAAGEAMAKANVLKGGAALEPRAAAGLGAPATGPTPTGYFIIEAADLAAARKLAASIPAAISGRVDIIPHASAKTGM